MIRLRKLSIKNLKNIGSGDIDFPIPDEEGGASLLGIYGQNGSGKSGVIDALEILKILMSGKTLEAYYADLIDTSADAAELAITLNADEGECRYQVVIGRDGGTPVLQSESFKSGGTLVTDTGKDHLSGCSSVFTGLYPKNSDDQIYRISEFASSGLQIIRTQNLNQIRLRDGGQDILLPLDTSFELAPEAVLPVRRELRQLSLVLEQMIPGMRMQLSAGNGRRFELETIRNGRTVPFRFESVGIQKLAATLPLLVRTFASDNAVLAADEFDFGINEYLFGEILEAYKKFGMGQLIFTSHNLRPLELLEPDEMVFATADPLKRFKVIKLPEDSTEMRELYYREILLGEGDLYERTSPYKISQALYEAGLEETGETGDPEPV